MKNNIIFVNEETKKTFRRIYNKGNYSIEPGKTILVYQISRHAFTSHQAFRLLNGVQFILEDSPSWNSLINGMIKVYPEYAHNVQ